MASALNCNGVPHINLRTRIICNKQFRRPMFYVNVDRFLLTYFVAKDLWKPSASSITYTESLVSCVLP